MNSRSYSSRDGRHVLGTHKRQPDAVARHDNDAVTGLLTIDFCHLLLRPTLASNGSGWMSTHRVESDCTPQESAVVTMHSITHRRSTFQMRPAAITTLQAFSGQSLV